MKALEKKISYVNDLQQIINMSNALFFLTFKGLSVQEVVELRKAMKKHNGEVKVVKNTLLRRALLNMGFEVDENVFRDTTMVVFSKGEPIELVKNLVTITKEKENLKIKGGIYDFRFISPQIIVQLSTLPSRNELIGQLIGLLKTPLTRLAYIIRTPYTSLVNTLFLIKKKKEES
jgi:large subunit ribosomal protein L10